MKRLFQLVSLFICMFASAMILSACCEKISPEEELKVEELQEDYFKYESPYRVDRYYESVLEK